jgi:hypothetical protein
LGRLRPRRLNESGDSGYGFGGWRLEGELLREESDAVAGGFGVERVRRVGKVRAIGASNYNAKRLGEALELSKKKGLPRYESLQPHYNLYERAGFETELALLFLRENIGVIPYFSLASGFLAGKYRSEVDLVKSVRGTFVKKYLNDRGFRILGALDANPSSSRLAAGPAGRYRSDCQRDKSRSAP